MISVSLWQEYKTLKRQGASAAHCCCPLSHCNCYRYALQNTSAFKLCLLYHKISSLSILDSTGVHLYLGALSILSSRWGMRKRASSTGSECPFTLKLCVWSALYLACPKQQMHPRLVTCPRSSAPRRRGSSSSGCRLSRCRCRRSAGWWSRDGRRDTSSPWRMAIRCPAKV
jgi:hypothetical protein